MYCSHAGKNISNSITHLHAKEVSIVLAWLRKFGLIIAGALLISAVSISWLTDRDDAVRTEYVAPDPIPSAMTSSSSPTPSPSASITPLPTPTPITLADPKPGDKPVEVVVMRGGKYIVKPVRIGSGTSFEGKRWSPVPGTAEWYQVDDYPKPGKLSTLNSVIAAHVAYSGEPDAFAQLEDVKEGDKVIVTYASKQTYTYTVTKIIVEDKLVIRNNQQIWGERSTKRRSTILFTCDDQSGYRSDGTRRDNRAVIATIDE